MRVTRTEIETHIAGNGRITEQDVLAIRRMIYPDGVISAGEADWLFDLNDRFEDHDEAWARLFVEALTDIAANQLQPLGHVTTENAQWVLDRVTRDGHVKSATELELVVNVVERAISSPDALAVFALQQVKHHVLRSNRLAEPEVQLLRRILHAAGGQRNIAISRQEAEVIYDLHDARGAMEEDAAWLDLFVKVILSHIMFASGYEPVTRDEALRRETWMDDTSMDVAKFLRRSVASILEPRRILAAMTQPDIHADQLRHHEATHAQAEEITDEEANWLAARMLRDGSISRAERILVDALRAERPRLHPVIQAAIDKIP